MPNAFQVKETERLSEDQPAEDLQTLEKETRNQNQEKEMTGLETLIAKELVSFVAKTIWQLVQSDENDLTADQAKSQSKSMLSDLSEDAQKVFKHNLPKEFKL